MDLLLCLLILSLGLGGLAVRMMQLDARDRRLRQGAETSYCRRCGYDLTGNVSGVCPECGAAVPHWERST